MTAAEVVMQSAKWLDGINYTREYMTRELMVLEIMTFDVGFVS